MPSLVREAETYEPRLIRSRFESPLLLVGEVPLETVATASKILLLLYFTKRVWKLPAEFETHDAEVKRRLVEAESNLFDAETRRDEALRRRQKSLASVREEPDKTRALQQIDARLQVDLGQIDDDFLWPRGTTSEIERRRRSRWRGESAVWTDEQEEI